MRGNMITADQRRRLEDLKQRLRRDTQDKDKDVPPAQAQANVAVVRLPDRTSAAELEARINGFMPGLAAVAHAAAANPAINNRNFIPWASSQLSWLGPRLLLLLLPLMFKLFWYLLYPDAENIADTEPEELQLMLSLLGSPQLFLDTAKTSAPANGVSVVDAVFAKAERKAERQAATR